MPAACLSPFVSVLAQGGQELREDDRIGSVGETGGATGPHPFFGARWHGARTDSQYLLRDPAKIPPVERLEP
jgi:murein DD-endopeptidase MepM/ murein hydrolase activator NlpD